MGPSKKAPRKPPKNFGRQLIYPAPEFTKEELAWYKVLAEGRKEIDRLLAIRDGIIPPPWKKEAAVTQRKKDRDKPAVRLARELIAAAYPKESWRALKPVTVRKGCERAADARGKALPGRDSFARAMGRRP